MESCPIHLCQREFHSPVRSASQLNLRGEIQKEYRTFSIYVHLRIPTTVVYVQGRGGVIKPTPTHLKIFLLKYILFL